MSHRRMNDSEFRRQQWERRYDPNVKVINEMVDRLRDGGPFMPYAAPYHGGDASRILLIFQDPGPMTNEANGGSGFLGCENDDPAAELLGDCLDAAGLDFKCVISWNAYPWYRHGETSFTTAMLVKGLAPLDELLDLLPTLRVVVTCGKKAHDSWSRYQGWKPAKASGYHHLQTFHTSRRGITNGGQQTRAEGTVHVKATLAEAKALAGC